MTVNELRTAARMLGYKIVKIEPTMLPCICGSRKKEHVSRYENGTWGQYMRCPECGLNVKGDTVPEMVNNWNKKIRGILS